MRTAAWETAPQIAVTGCSREMGGEDQNRHDFGKYGVTSLVAQRVKHLPTMWETQVQTLGWEYLLEKEMTAHSSILAWKIPWREEPGGLYSLWGHKELTNIKPNITSEVDWATSLSLFKTVNIYSIVRVLTRLQQWNIRGKHSFSLEDEFAEFSEAFSSELSQTWFSFKGFSSLPEVN